MTYDWISKILARVDLELQNVEEKLKISNALLEDDHTQKLHMLS